MIFLLYHDKSYRKAYSICPISDKPAYVQPGKITHSLKSNICLYERFMSSPDCAYLQFSLGFHKYHKQLLYSLKLSFNGYMYC